MAVNANDIWALVMQRADCLVDLYIGEAQELNITGQKIQKNIKAPIIPPIVTGLHFGEARGFALARGIPASNIAMHFVPSKVIKKYRQDAFKEKFGVAKRDIIELIHTKNKFINLIEEASKIPTAEVLAIMSKKDLEFCENIHTRISELKGVASEFKNILESEIKNYNDIIKKEKITA